MSGLKSRLWKSSLKIWQSFIGRVYMVFGEENNISVSIDIFWMRDGKKRSKTVGKHDVGSWRDHLWPTFISLLNFHPPPLPTSSRVCFNTLIFHVFYHDTSSGLLRGGLFLFAWWVIKSFWWRNPSHIYRPQYNDPLSNHSQCRNDSMATR